MADNWPLGSSFRPCSSVKK